MKFQILDRVGPPFVVPSREWRGLDPVLVERLVVEHARRAFADGARVTWPYSGPMTLVLP